MPRFVLLRHETPANRDRPVHWDLMLERDDVLWTWALPREPLPRQLLVAQRLADHRLAYLDYEGPISGDRGQVRRVTSGEFDFVRVTEDRVQIRTTSGQLPRRIELVRQTDAQRWNVTFDDRK